jgi:hypothetical protein
MQIRENETECPRYRLGITVVAPSPDGLDIFSARKAESWLLCVSGGQSRKRDLKQAPGICAGPWPSADKWFLDEGNYADI